MTPTTQIDLTVQEKKTTSGVALQAPIYNIFSHFLNFRLERDLRIYFVSVPSQLSIVTDHSIERLTEFQILSRVGGIGNLPVSKELFFFNHKNIVFQWDKRQLTFTEHYEEPNMYVSFKSQTDPILQKRKARVSPKVIPTVRGRAKSSPGPHKMVRGECVR